MGAPDGAFSINFAPAQQISANLATYTRDIQKMVEDLKTYTDAKLQYWEASAQLEYADAKTIWDAAIIDLNEKLGNAQRILTEIITNYETTEAKNTASWAK
ncbi:hypothetical protein GCM10027290_28220 [Micromonospora sonneratiae]|uniref:WXG100 family type VII secretion target n=1 Tax=Micromonospora sonneratiae TaxID=1184706 RepID=A0ABW3Y800_9ACTN